MLKKLIVFLATVVVLAATHARALGLGDLTLESALNQPLSARIELLQTTGVRMEDIRVQMATASDFERFSLDRPYYLDSIRFNIRDAGPDNEQPYIELTSVSPIREPYLSFVLDTRWPRGRVLAEYTVLLDPPSFANEGAVQAPQPPVTTRFEAPEADAAEPEAARQAAAGAEAPAPQQSPSSDAQDLPPSSVDAESDPTAADDTAASPEPQRFADTAGTVEVGGEDTLWDIALQVRPDDSVTVQQTMLALQRLNPDAFINGNVNLVRRGAVLRVPDADSVRDVANAEAISEVGRQNRLFEDRRDAPLGSEPLAPPPAEDGSAASGDGELSVVSVDEESSDETGSASADAAAGEELQELDDRIDALEDQLAVSREEADRVERENEELDERLSMLEEQIESAREIIRLRDLELAQLQESLASDDANGQPAETGGDQQESTAPPPAVTMAPEAPLPQQIIGVVLANPMVLGAILALVVALLVLLLIRRNKTKQAELAEEQHEQDDEEELDFSGVGTAAADRDDTDEDDGSGDDGGHAASPDRESPASREPFEHHEDDDELVDELRGFDEQGRQALVSEELDDLLAEVDALIDHQQYEEARKLLEDAIVADPNRQELRVRLLEVLVAQQDLETYRLQESELGTVSSPALQQRVQVLREQVAALESRHEEDTEVDTDMRQDSSDFSDLSEEDDLELELDMESSAEVDDNKVVQGGEDQAPVGGQDDGTAQTDEREEDEDGFDFDLDLDLDDEESETGAEQPEREKSPEPFDGDAPPVEEDSEAAEERATEESLSDEETAGDEDFEFDFDLDLEPADPDAATEQESEAPEEAAFDRVDDEPEKAAGAPEPEREDEDFDFSLDDFALDAETDTALPDTEEGDAAAGETPVRGEEQESDRTSDAEDAEEDPFADLSFTDSDAEEEELSGLPDDEFEFLSDTDEAATKLDLARAYIDMGDSEGAREILEEVIKEGTEAQADDARQLIDRLD